MVARAKRPGTAPLAVAPAGTLRSTQPRAKRQRADVALVERGLAPTREKAQRLILAGQILEGDRPVSKPGEAVREPTALRLREAVIGYVSRGGLKLAHAIDRFGLNPSGACALDVGASTGGFTDVLLQRGARRVYALDVGHSQLDWKIRSDPRVVVLERCNARTLTFEQIGEHVDWIVVDVSFISLGKILGALRNVATATTHWLTLIKPQFEVGPEHVGKGGIVTDPAQRIAAIEQVRAQALALGLVERGLIDSPITGTDGNHEYLAHWTWLAPSTDPTSLSPS